MSVKCSKHVLNYDLFESFRSRNLRFDIHGFYLLLRSKCFHRIVFKTFENLKSAGANNLQKLPKLRFILNC